MEKYTCEACNSEVSLSDQSCPTCGIFFVNDNIMQKEEIKILDLMMMLCSFVKIDQAIINCAKFSGITDKNNTEFAKKLADFEAGVYDKTHESLVWELYGLIEPDIQKLPGNPENAPLNLNQPIIKIGE